MLVSSEITFNQADFDRRLRHYFSESAPCYIRYAIGFDYISVCEDPGEWIEIKLNRDFSEEENVRLVVENCEEYLYPRLVKVTSEVIPLPTDEVTSLLNKGKTLIEIMEKASQRRKEFWLIITRIGLNNNTLVLRDKNTGVKTIYELLYMPVFKFLEWLKEGKYTSETGYEYLLKNSRITAAKA